MTRLVKRMPTPQGIGAGQTATVNLPLGLTYERLMIRAQIGGVDVNSDAWKFSIGGIRLLVDGDAKIELTADALVNLNSYYGQDSVDGVLQLFLSRPWMRTIGGEDQTAYGTAGGISTLTIEIDILDDINFSSLEVFAVQSPGTPFGAHLRIQRYVHNQGVTGEAEIADITRGQYAMLAMHIDTKQIGDVEVLADQRVIHKSDEAIREAHYGVIGRKVRPGLTHVDFVTENRLVEALPMSLQDFRIRLDFETTGNFSIFTESVQGRTG